MKITARPDLKMSASAFPKNRLSWLSSFLPISSERQHNNNHLIVLWAETILCLWKTKQSSKNITQQIPLMHEQVLFYIFILFMSHDLRSQHACAGKVHTIFLSSRLICVHLLRKRQADETWTVSVFGMTIRACFFGPQRADVTIKIQDLNEADSI